MPKKKTSKTVAKRFRLTASGKLKYVCAGRRHLMASKSRKRKRRLRKPGILSKAETRRIVNLLTS